MTTICKKELARANGRCTLGLGRGGTRPFRAGKRNGAGGPGHCLWDDWASFIETELLAITANQELEAGAILSATSLQMALVDRGANPRIITKMVVVTRADPVTRKEIVRRLTTPSGSRRRARREGIERVISATPKMGPRRSSILAMPIRDGAAKGHKSSYPHPASPNVEAVSSTSTSYWYKTPKI